MRYIVAFIAAALAGDALAGSCPTRCEYLPWSGWSSCTRTCGGGSRKRSRQICCNSDILAREGIHGCLRDCNIHDGGHFHEWETCAKICYNGGTFVTSWCHCSLGYYGSCCENRIYCGDPGDISNGVKNGNNYYYNDVVTYNCNSDYKVSSGSLSIKCQLSGRWNGTKPTCTFYNTCKSNPCQNAGTCVNDFDRYSCLCTSSFSGINCERDIQPPLVDSCPGDLYVNTTDRRTYVNWTIPTFHDPLGNYVRVSTNYPTGDHDFSWGDYTVQYFALKPSNGLSSQCIFKIKVRPNRCEPLSVPVGGAIACNGWKQDYGQFCLQFCGNNYTVSRQYDLRQWYVCGASGSWIPGNSLPNCTDKLTSSALQEGMEKHQFNACVTEKTYLQSTYIDVLQSSRYKFFCDTYKDTCVKNHVYITCQ